MKGLLQELKDQKSVFTLQSDKYADNGGLEIIRQYIEQQDSPAV